MGQASSGGPIPPDSIVNDQKLEWGDCYCGYKGNVTPSWNSGVVNSKLVNQGFDQHALNTEIEKINEISQRFIEANGNCCRYYWWLGAVIAVLMVIVPLIVIAIIDPAWLFVLAGCIGGAILIIYLFNWPIHCYYLKLWDGCLQHIEDYINNELNKEYVGKNIEWSVNRKKLWHGCGKNQVLTKYMDIVVTPNSKYTPPQTQTESVNHHETDLLIHNK